MNRLRVIGVGVGTAALAATALTGIAAGHPSSVTLPADRIDRPVQQLISPKRLLVLGASYTAGLGASAPGQGYAEQLGRELGWPTTVAGSPGTGFVNPGPQRTGTYAQRLARLHIPAPGLVLIQCGRNDVGYPAEQQRAAITRTIQLIRQRFSGPQIVFLGPIPGGLPVTRGVAQQSQLLAKTARGLNVPYIDPVTQGWITPQNVRGYTGRIPNHPDDAGYGYIAHRTAAALRELFPATFR